MRWLWRISQHADLTGVGGEKASARWHTAAPGKRIVYLAEHPAVCLIETLVNLKSNSSFFPNTFSLMKVGIDEILSMTHIAAEELPNGWRESNGVTRSLGDSWLARNASALLTVPSAPSPESVNYLLNPRHPDSKSVALAWHRRVAYDKRLFRLSDSVKLQSDNG